MQPAYQYRHQQFGKGLTCPSDSHIKPLQLGAHQKQYQPSSAQTHVLVHPSQENLNSYQSPTFVRPELLLMRAQADSYPDFTSHCRAVSHFSICVLYRSNNSKREFCSSAFTSLGFVLPALKFRAAHPHRHSWKRLAGIFTTKDHGVWLEMCFQPPFRLRAGECG